MSPGKEPLELPARAGTNTSEKVVVTFRFPRDLAGWLGREAEKRGWSMNEFMVTVAHDLFGWYSLPDIVVEQLEPGALGPELVRPRQTRARNCLGTRGFTNSGNGPASASARVTPQISRRAR
jgi:hypothetical protein